MDDQEYLDRVAIAALPTVLQHEYSDSFADAPVRCYRIAEAMLAERARRTPPGLDALEPQTAAIGAPSFTLHVKGSGFTKESVIIWNGSPEPTTFVSPTELTTGVNMETAEVPIALPVLVTTGNLASEPLIFTLTGTRKRESKGGER